MILKGQPIITSPLIALLFRAFYFQLYVTSRLREPLEIKEHLLVLGSFSRLLMALRFLGPGCAAPLMFPSSLRSRIWKKITFIIGQFLRLIRCSLSLAPMDLKLGLFLARVMTPLRYGHPGVFCPIGEHRLVHPVIVTSNTAQT